MHATVLAATLLLAVPSPAKDPDPFSLVGLRLPDAGRGDWVGWHGEQAWRVGDQAAGPDDPTEYGGAIWTRGHQAVVFLTLRGVVKDVVTVDVPDRHRILGYACVVGGGGTLEPEVIVVVPWTERCVFPSVHAAWRLDRAHGRIERTATEGLRCQDSSRGCD